MPRCLRAIKPIGMELWSILFNHHLHRGHRKTQIPNAGKPPSYGAMELWSSLLNHHLHERDNTSFADPAGCSSYGARHATCKDKAPRERSTQTTPSRNLTLGVIRRQATSTTNAQPDSLTPPGRGTRTSSQGGGFATMSKGH